MKRSVAKAQAKTQRKKAVSVKTKTLAFKVSPEQYAAIEERAASSGLFTGTWIRAIVLQAAMTPKNGRFIKINEPDGATT